MWGDMRASAGCEADSRGKNAQTLSLLRAASALLTHAPTAVSGCRVWLKSLVEATDADDAHLRRLANSGNGDSAERRFSWASLWQVHAECHVLIPPPGGYVTPCGVSLCATAADALEPRGEQRRVPALTAPGDDSLQTLCRVTSANHEPPPHFSPNETQYREQGHTFPFLFLRNEATD